MDHKNTNRPASDAEWYPAFLFVLRKEPRTCSASWPGYCAGQSWRAPPGPPGRKSGSPVQIPPTHGHTGCGRKWDRQGRRIQAQHAAEAGSPGPAACC